MAGKCNVCLEDIGEVNNTEIFRSRWMTCRHGDNTCKSCWMAYLSHSTQTRACVGLMCIIPNCNEKVPLNVWNWLRSENENAYNRYKMFVEQNQSIQVN